MRHSSVLSEPESMRLLEPLGLPFPRWRTADSAAAAVAAAADIGYPVAIKVSGSGIAHKTERGMVELGVGDAAGVERALERLTTVVRPEDGDTTFLVTEMVGGRRELILGAHRDGAFGPVLLLGWGGVLTEAIGRVATVPFPVTRRDLLDLCRRAGLGPLLGSVRGDDAVELDQLEAIVGALGAAMSTHPAIASIDVNPLKIRPDGRLVAVDCLVVEGPVEGSRAATDFIPAPRHFRALFEPDSVVVVGASTHPGKFGFVTLHNIIAGGFGGSVAATNPGEPEILGITSVPSVADIDGTIDLAVICTPASANEQVVRECAAKGARAVFVASAGYRESGDGEAEARLAALCTSLDVMMVGPNGQGVVSTPASLCAQIVAPMPPSGRMSIASQSGNLVSSFENMAVASGVGVSRAVSLGNSAQVGVGEFLRCFADDPETAVAIAYVEDPGRGSYLSEAVRYASARKPVVVIKGGTTAAGTRAAASHTGALTSDSGVFEGAMRAAGAFLAVDPEEAFDVAAAFATQPIPRGNRTVVLTTVGGWGVLTADAMSRDGRLHLVELPTDLVEVINGLLPPRWSRSNPIDCAGGETRDTIPALIEAVTAHPDVDAVLLLGLGIQSNQAAMMAKGPFADDPDVGRIVDYHRRQDARYVEAALEASSRHEKPVLVATELAVCDPSNPGPATARRHGSHCFPSGPRAARALGAMAEWAARMEAP